MVLLQIRTTAVGQGLPSPATLLFNHPVCGIMPVMDRKPINIDNDDEHHKNLMHRQGKNNQNNDTSRILVSIPTGSTVVVQQEDRGLKSHGTITGKGNHNHHSRTYKIQVTNTGIIITHNRQHIKPTPITTEDYMCYQASKQTKTDPLNGILDHIQRNPHTYMDKAISNERDDNKNVCSEQGVKTIYKAAEKNKQKKYVLIQGWSMKIYMKGETLLKPDREGL